jgi:hypothetical protein
MRKYLKSQSK